MKLKYGTQWQVSFSDLNEYYFALGFLANSRNAEFRWENNEDQGAWGSEGRIHCLVPETQFPQCFRFTAGRGNVYARINCNEYVGHLVTNHNFNYNSRGQNLEKILETVPEQYRRVFQDGYGSRITYNPKYIEKQNTPARKENTNSTVHQPEPIVKKKSTLISVENNCIVEAIIPQTQKNTRLTINLEKYPKQTVAIGKRVGEIIDLGIKGISYKITAIYREE